jgi:hypothetical protein
MKIELQTIYKHGRIPPEDMKMVCKLKGTSKASYKFVVKKMDFR